MNNFLRSMLRPSSLLSPSDRNLYKTLKQMLGFYPGNIEIYKLAFRHKSLAGYNEKNNYSNNERLEFLGDSVLGAIVSNYIFCKYPYKDEGFLTEMRSKLVSRAQLNFIGQKIGIARFQETSEKSSKSLYGDTFEALIGAIFIDKGFLAARKYVLNKIIMLHIDIEELEAKEINFKGKLIDWAQKERKEINFEIVEETGNSDDKKYRIRVVIDNNPMGEAIAFSKKKAEQIAAEKTCVTLGLNEKKDTHN